MIIFLLFKTEYPLIKIITKFTDKDFDYTNENSRVSIEHKDPAQRNITLEKIAAEEWDSASAIYLGYPIWWGEAAWPINNFIKSNDFTGKTIIPFCTSSSSGLGESGELLKKTAGTGNWLEGIRFSSDVSAEDVRELVENQEK